MEVGPSGCRDYRDRCSEFVSAGFMVQGSCDLVVRKWGHLMNDPAKP